MKMVSRSRPELTDFLNTQQHSRCTPDAIHWFKPTLSMHRELRANNGEVLDARYQVVLGPGFVLGLWGARALWSILIVVFWYAIRSRMKHQQAILALKSQHADEIFNIAAQVFHDITSPVQALNGLLEGTEQTKVPVEIRVKLRTEIRRIHDIAQDLLSRSRQRNSEQGDQVQVSEERAPELLTPLIDGIISEKRMAHEKNKELQVSFHHAAEDFGIFASVNAAKFERLISNLLNNAIEALPNGTGKVEIKMAKQRDLIVLTIADSGSGIPPEILSQLGRRGATFGRKNGNGLGLFDAKATFEGWGGDFQIESEVGKGTRIQILLRQARPPRWFADTLYLAPGQRIVILDDDDRTHEIWKQRFGQLSSGDGFEVLSFRTGDDFKVWFQNAKRSEIPDLYLFDHDLSEGSESGLDITESIGISSSTILVTGRPDIQSLRPRCEQSGCRLLPKTLLETVPIHAVTPQSVKPDAIFIDDESIHLSRWERSAKKSGKDQADVAALLGEDSKEFDKKYSGLVTALGHFSQGAVAPLFNTETPGIILADVIRERKICYFQLPTMQYPFLGEATGKLVLQCLQSAISEMQVNGKKNPSLFSVYLDDFNDYIYPAFISILNKSRSAGIGVVFAHQSIGDLKKVGEEFTQSFLTNTNVKIIMRSPDPESAEYFAKSIGTKTGEKATERRSRFFLGFKRNTGEQSVRDVEEYIIHPNEFKSGLGTGEGITIIPHSKGRLVKRIKFAMVPDLGPISLPVYHRAPIAFESEAYAPGTDPAAISLPARGNGNSAHADNNNPPTQ